MIPYILFFLLFIIPYVILPFGVTQFEDPKVIVSEIAIIVMAASLFFGKSEKSSYTVFKRSTHSKYLFILLGSLTLIHLIFLQDSTVLFGNSFRLQGVLLLWFLMLFSIVSSRVFLPKVHWGVYIFFLFLEVLLMFFLLPTNESNRYVGTLGEPNATAALAIFMWPFVYFGIKKFKHVERIGAAVTLLCVVSILYFTESRSAVVALIIQLICLFLLVKKVRIKTILITSLVLLVFSFTLPFFENNEFENRTDVWQSAIAANDTVQKILIGAGFGNIENSLLTSAQKLNLPIQYNYVDSAHNIFLDWWVQGGLVGILILIGLIYFAFKNFIAHQKNLEIVLILGVLTVLSFNPGSISSLILFWWLIGKGLPNYPAK